MQVPSTNETPHCTQCGLGRAQAQSTLTMKPLARSLLFSEAFPDIHVHELSAESHRIADHEALAEVVRFNVEPSTGLADKVMPPKVTPDPRFDDPPGQQGPGKGPSQAPPKDKTMQPQHSKTPQSKKC